MAVLQSQLRLSLLDQVSAPIRKVSGALSGLQRQTMAFTNPLRGAIGQLAAFGGAYVGITEGLKATIGSAITFESAFADVRKVVEASDEQFGNMRRTIRQMSTEIPMTANDIAALFAAAGESGIATTELKEFSEMAARVGIAFDIGAGQAGETLAKLKTQLGVSVADVGSLADAINHLSNNMASKASDITDFMLRVSALGKMGGFTAEQIAGIGSAMIAAGAPSEVAGTAMQNVVKALTRGNFAKKDQRDAAKALGLDLPQIAKQMQKDAPKALKTVLKAIAKAPKDQHIAILSQFFGDEAKAFAPLIGNVGLLDQALDSVADKAKYTGSAFNEFVQRSSTAANAAQLLGNKISNRFWEMGDRMLPTIKEGIAGISEVIDTLDSRVSIFDKMETSIMGFAQGLGYNGVKDVIADLGDLLFGKVDGTAGDQLGRLFMQAKEWGATIRELSAAIKENPIAQFFADLAPYGFQIMVWGAGIASLAGTVRKLAAAMMFLSGASAIIGALKAAGTIADVVSGGTMPGGKGGGKAGSAGTSVPKPDTGVMATLAAWGSWVKGAVVAGAPGLMSEAMSFTPGDTFEDQVRLQKQHREDLERITGINRAALTQGWQRNFGQTTLPGVGAQQAMDNARAFGPGGRTTDQLPGKTADDLGIVRTTRIDSSSIAAMIQPSGTQDVRVTNPQPPNVTVHAPISITGVADPQAAASSAASQLGESVRAAVESADTD
ncbi:phage tail tape measure protein [Neorhizobium sp. JUb45]|uniref:phage tail tape measure protein n=1 Tax=Neorhizobium sp. JUb45 TaxID=2485113 RepID=UPI00104F8F2B|nr:phage tail tape measure protein [Neorhizobium sp. JUb45]TCR07274.1 TP901 family phage tail tape measure protein [Neorhizobium sp. JUb45]